ncbi:MAG: hypothetical protein SFV24_01560 [Gemmatimonadales bacterium]|nr:hypothetical protein [Gemmatimonadales bacterium]
MSRLRYGLALAGVATLVACTSLQQLAALRQVAFSLVGVQQGRLAGVDLSRITDYSKLSVLDIGKITVAVARKDLPLEFQLGVRAENPAENKVTARMVRLAWSLYLDQKETISGVVDTAVVIPPGEPTLIPMRLRLNLLQFFDGPAQDLVNLATALAGLNADPTRISLKAVPTIDTPIGPISYPNPVTIVSRTVGGSGPAKP